LNAPSHESLDDAQFRARHVGSSEVSALFDTCPYLTKFELWHRKKGNIATPAFDVIGPDGTPDDERIYWGIRLEGAILEAAAERYGYTDIERNPRLSNGNGLGAHPDALATCPQRGRGYVEIKMADWLVRKQWGDEPPAHYLLQSQAGQGLANVEWGDVLVLVGGNRLERFCYDFRPKIYAEIERRVADFWQSIEANDPPPADYTRDLGTITELYREGTDETVDLTADNLAHEAAAAFLFAKEARLDAEKREDAAKAELLDKLGAASVALLNGFTVRATTVAAVPERVAEPGEIIRGRRAYRRLTVKELR
jgi:predicted phage-related endonuclease